MTKPEREPLLTKSREKPIVLVVDEERVRCNATVQSAWDAGYSAVGTNTADGALSLLRGGIRVDLLVLHIDMNDAWTVWHERTTNDRLKRVPVIVLSDFPRDAAVGDALMLTAPVDRDTLIAAFANVRAPP